MELVIYKTPPFGMPGNKPLRNEFFHSPSDGHITYIVSQSHLSFAQKFISGQKFTGFDFGDQIFFKGIGSVTAAQFFFTHKTDGGTGYTIKADDRFLNFSTPTEAVSKVIQKKW